MGRSFRNANRMNETIIGPNIMVERRAQGGVVCGPKVPLVETRLALP